MAAPWYSNASIQGGALVDPSTGTKYALPPLFGAPVLAGVIILANPTVDGNPNSAAATINTQTLSGTMSGQQLLYGTVHRDDFGGMATSILTYPGEIIVPAGVRYGRFTSSVAFPPEAGGVANGIRWNRIILGPYATPTHKGNSGGRPAVATVGNTLQTITGIYEVNAGDHYLTTAIQNCGSGLTLGVGTPANNWASNWFMAEFFY